MMGANWKRVQGPNDTLLSRVVAEKGLDAVPQWSKPNNVRMYANRHWMAMAPDRDGSAAEEA